MSQTSQDVLQLYVQIISQMNVLFQAMISNWLTAVMIVILMISIILRIFLTLRGKK